MTTEFHQMITCPKCRYELTIETDSGRWMRDHPRLDSRSEGFVLTNCDHIVLRFKNDRTGKDVQTMMVVEIKEHGKELGDCQAEIFHFFNQAIRWTAGLYPWSQFAGKRIKLLNFGAHRLMFQNTSPLNSEWIKWDGRLIDTDIENTLVKILRMDVLPDDIDVSMQDYLRSLEP